MPRVCTRSCVCELPATTSRLRHLMFTATTKILGEVFKERQVCTILSTTRVITSFAHSLHTFIDFFFNFLSYESKDTPTLPPSNTIHKWLIHAVLEQIPVWNWKTHKQTYTTQISLTKVLRPSARKIILTLNRITRIAYNAKWNIHIAIPSPRTWHGLAWTIGIGRSGSSTWSRFREMTFESGISRTLI